MEGIFCAKFYWTLGGFPPCHSAWCGSCYTLEGQDHFHVAPQQTQNTEVAAAEEDHMMAISSKWKET